LLSSSLRLCVAALDQPQRVQVVDEDLRRSGQMAPLPHPGRVSTGERLVQGLSLALKGAGDALAWLQWFDYSCRMFRIKQIPELAAWLSSIKA
jgi:hypothetical protein